jgi:urease subunit alpha
VIALVREPNVICSSTTPTIPWGVSAVDEGLAMTVLNHGGSFGVEEDLALIRERVHPATMAAEGPLHELGAIQIVNSDSQGMGRIGETFRRTFQLAHAMQAWRATETGASHPGLPPLPDEASDGTAADGRPRADNARALRYLAKVTIEPSIVHGVADHVGSLRPGRLADIVLWKPAYFGVKPEVVLKGGHVAWAPLGEGNATVEGAEPTRFARHWAGLPHGAPSVSALFVASSADVAALRRRLDTARDIVAISGCRGLRRDGLHLNRATAPIEVDPRDGRVTLAGRPLATEPLREVPLSRRYFLR